jgi:hypothetical protein
MSFETVKKVFCQNSKNLCDKDSSDKFMGNCHDLASLGDKNISSSPEYACLEKIINDVKNVNNNKDIYNNNNILYRGLKDLRNFFEKCDKEGFDASNHIDKSLGFQFMNNQNKPAPEEEGFDAYKLIDTSLSYQLLKNPFDSPRPDFNISLEGFQSVKTNTLIPGTKYKTKYDIVSSTDGCSEFETINPIEDGCRRKDINVSYYGNFLFEGDPQEDELNQATDKETYIKEFKERWINHANNLLSLGLINRIVDSGSKSIHCRVTLEDAPESKEEYVFCWKILNEKLFNNSADTNCSNPARLTRHPRGLRRDNNKIQTLLGFKFTKLRWNWRPLFEAYKQEKQEEQFYREYARNIKNDYLPAINNQCTLAELASRNICQEAKDLINGELKDGERHKKIWSALKSLKACNRSYDECAELAESTGIKDWEHITQVVFETEEDE